MEEVLAIQLPKVAWAMLQQGWPQSTGKEASDRPPI